MLPADRRSRVLIVAVGSSIVRALESALQREGFETSSALPGREAARALRELQPELIVLDLGASDVAARVRTALRAQESVLRFADLVLDEETHEVLRAGKPVELTPTEFRLLRFFLLNPRRVLTKHQIIDNVWDDFDGDPNVVHTYVSYVRKKLDRLGPPLIQTVRFLGYALREPRL